MKKLGEVFKDIDERQEFEMVFNGFILRVSGRGHDDEWLSKAFIYETDTDLFEAISELVSLRQ
jgi:hypothetical protein